MTREERHEKKPLTKKQVYEFAKIYVGSQMWFIDSGNLGDIDHLVSQSDKDRLVEQVTLQGQRILGNRPIKPSPDKILKYLGVKPVEDCIEKTKP